MGADTASAKEPKRAGSAAGRARRTHKLEEPGTTTTGSKTSIQRPVRTKGGKAAEPENDPVDSDATVDAGGTTEVHEAEHGGPPVALGGEDGIIEEEFEKLGLSRGRLGASKTGTKAGKDKPSKASILPSTATTTNPSRSRSSTLNDKSKDTTGNKQGNPKNKPEPAKSRHTQPRAATFTTEPDPKLFTSGSKKQQYGPAIGPEEPKKLPGYLDKPGNRPGLRSHSRHQTGGGATVQGGLQKPSGKLKANSVPGRAPSGTTTQQHKVTFAQQGENKEQTSWFERLSTPKKGAEKAVPPSANVSPVSRAVGRKVPAGVAGDKEKATVNGRGNRRGLQ